MSNARSRSYEVPIAPDVGAVDAPGAAIGDGRNAKNDSSNKEAKSSVAANREIRYWLEWQSRMISGVISGGIFIALDLADAIKFHETIWPETAKDTVLLRKIAVDTIQGEKNVVRGNVVTGSDIVDIVACPIRHNQKLVGAVVFELTNRTQAQRESVQQLLQWCVVWLENLMDSPTNAETGAAKSQLQLVNLLSAVAPLEVSGYELCSYLADEFDCSLVALGLCQELSVSALAVSNQLEFDPKTQRIGEIELAMEECADQDLVISVSPEQSDLSAISQAHNQLLKKNAELVVRSLPVRATNKLIGVLTFVKSQDIPFSVEQQREMNDIVNAIGPVLKLQTVVNQSLSEKIRLSATEYLKKLVGRNNVKFKTITGLLLLIPLLLAIVPAEQRVSAAASLEGSMQQAIVAPTDGYIKSVHARAGDTVAAGQSLVTLDDNSLVLQYEKWSAERDKLASEYQLAWATRDKAQVSIASARLEQSKAQLALVESEMAHSKIVAPFEGLLISGDLSRLSGTPVEQGQLLFQLVPLTGFKVTLNIDEYDVGKLADGQRGVLRLTGSPDKPIDFIIQKAFPVASVQQDQNVFRVEAILQNPPENLRPGMQGVGKISVGKSSIGAVWTQSLRERLKMSAWYFGF